MSPGIVIRQAAALLLLALVPSLLSAWLHPWQADQPSEADGVQAITLSDALAMSGGQQVLWIDARHADAWRADHIPGAINLSLAAWEQQLVNFVEAWIPDQPVIVYCDSASCGAALSVARRLVREFEATNIFYLDGGWESWKQSQP